MFVVGFPGGAVVKGPPSNAGGTRDVGLIPGWGTVPGVGSGSPLQYSCLENSTHSRAWWGTVHGVTKSCMCPSTQTTRHVHFGENLNKSNLTYSRPPR